MAVIGDQFGDEQRGERPGHQPADEARAQDHGRSEPEVTREPGGIEAEALQVEQVGGVVACIHREGEHEPGQDEAPGDERRREQCERSGS